MLKTAFATSLLAASVLAISAPAAAEPTPAPAPAAAPAAAPKPSTTDTTIGDLLDNPATKAVLDKHMPGFSSNPQVEMARGMTLRAVQPMVPDQIKVDTLDKIDADLAK